MKARFSEAAAAALRGERVIVTRHGDPLVELVPARKRGVEFGKVEHIRTALDHAEPSTNCSWGKPASKVCVCSTDTKLLSHLLAYAPGQ